MRKGYSLWGNGGGDDVFIVDNITKIEAAIKMYDQHPEEGWNYFLVIPSRTEICQKRGNVNASDIAITQIPTLHNSDEFWVCDCDGEIREHKHCSECSLLSVGQILLNRLDYADRFRIEEERHFPLD